MRSASSLPRFPRVLGRRPVRLRLALVYSGLFLIAGVVLLSVTYGLVADSLPTTASSLQVGKVLDGAYPAAKICKEKATTPAETELCKQEATKAAQAFADTTVRSARAQTLRHLLWYSLAGLAFMALVSTLLGWIVAGRVLRPVHAITAAARRASEENLGERIALSGPDDELKELADTFDAMLARLDSAFASQRRFVANASHELRTPLTVMRTAIDVTLAKPRRTPEQLETMATEVRQAADRAEALIEALLTLARSDRGQGPRSAFDMAVFAEDALDAAAATIKARSLTVDSALEPGTAVGDPVMVERLVTNLIDNAVRHNVPDGWIQVTTGTRDGMAFIAVANSGPVIPDPDVPGLFEPFRRRCPHGGPAGTGLGLSIVQSVVAAHHGQLFARSDPLGGLTVTAMLPPG
jgi:signal transduction histidine kinase